MLDLGLSFVRRTRNIPLVVIAGVTLFLWCVVVSSCKRSDHSRCCSGWTNMKVGPVGLRMSPWACLSLLECRSISFVVFGGNGW